MEQLPSILALLGVVITVAVNLVLGLVKSRSDGKTVVNSAEKDLRDDLLELIDRYEENIKDKDTKLEQKDAKLAQKDIQVAEMQKTISTLLDENLTLKLDNKRKDYEIQTLKAELDKFERKVFYKPNNNGENNESTS